MKNIILHIGIPKTASSSIQEFLYYNRESLLKEGVYYPKSWEQNHSCPIQSIFGENPELYHGNIKASRNGETLNNYIKSRYDSIVNELENCESDTFIFSSEDLAFISKDSLKEIKTFLERFAPNAKITIIAYVRELLNWHISALQEQVKGELYSIEGVKVKSKFYSRIFNKYIELFGKSNIKVFAFEEIVKTKNGIINHFLKQAGFNGSKIYSINKKNAGISHIALDIISFINSKEPLIIDGELNDKRFFGDTHPIHKLRGDKFSLNNSGKKNIYNSNEGELKWLFDNFDISYSVDEKKSTGIKDSFKTQELIEDLKSVFQDLSVLIKENIILYLIENKGNFKHQNLIDDFISKMEKEYFYIFSNKDIFGRFRNSLDVNEKAKDADILREISLVLEELNLTESAYETMKMAYSIRPQGPFIKSKLDDFKMKIEYEKNSRFFFLHIPKTAGTSFRNTLTNVFKEKDTFPNKLILNENEGKYPKVEKIDYYYKIDKFENIKLFQGHYSYDVMSKYYPNSRILCFFRNPVDRAISNLKHLKRNFPELSEKSLEEIAGLNSGSPEAQITNFQYRLLGSGNIEEKFEKLESFDFIGISEEYERSIKLCNYSFNWSLPVNVKLNQSAENIEVSKHLVDFLLENNKLDMAIYNKAKRIFERRYKAFKDASES